MTKRKTQSSINNPDIRNFFTPSPGPRKSKLASRFFNGGASVLGTPSTAAATPPPCSVLVAGSTSTSTSSSQDLDSRLSASSTDTVEADPLEHPTPSKLSALRSRRALEETALVSPEKEVAVIGTSSGTGATAAATANQVQITRVTKEDDKENARRAMAAPSGSGAATTVAELKSTRSSSRAMSDFFLVGPTPAPRSGGHGRAEAESDSRHVLNQNRFALPTGKSVLGRNSVRDTSPDNRNKIRIGINSREEGISRSQATLQVHRSKAFITVTNNPNVPNPIRVRRSAAFQRSAAGEVNMPADQRMNPKPPEVQVLVRGQTTKLYPGDTLQLDGFRIPNRSKYSYALYLLSAVGAIPVGVGARAGAATAPPEVVAARAMPGASSGLGDRADATATKRSRSENDVGSPLFPLSSKFLRNSSPRIPVGGCSVSSREGAASEEPFEKVDAKGGSQRLDGGGGGGEAPLLLSSSEIDTFADTVKGDTRLTVPPKRVAESCSVDLPEAGVPAKSTSHVSEPPGPLKGAAVSAPEDKVLLRDDCDAVGLPKPQTDATPAERGADTTYSDLAGTGDRAEGVEGESPSSARVSAGRLWSVHDVVQLVPRVGKGENKLGGVAHVKRVFEDGSYLVKLVIPGAAPMRVSADLLSRFEPSPDGLATRGRRSLPAARGHHPPERGERARVLYDEYDWYMGTVIQVHGDGGVTVRFDEGFEEKLELVPGQSETCLDHDLSPPVQARLTFTSSRSRGGSAGHSKNFRAVQKDWRALDPWGGRILGGEDGKLLTKARATALLDTAPEKLSGLTYREKVLGFGWWHAVVREVVFGGAGGKKHGVDSSWPVAVMVDSEPVGSAQGAQKGNSDKDRLRTFGSKLEIRVFLRKLHAWDKHCEEIAKLKRAEEQPQKELRKTSPSKKVSPRKKTNARSPSGGKKTTAKSTSPRVKTRGVTVTLSKNAVVPPEKVKGGKGRRTVAPRVAVTIAAVASRNASELETAAAAVQTAAPSPSRQAASVVEMVDNKDTTVQDVASKNMAAKHSREAAKKQAALKRKAAAERGRTTCPFCGSEFYSTEPRELINAHLATCSRKAAQEAASAEAEEREPRSAAVGGVATKPARTSSAVRVGDAVMTKTLSSALSIDMKSGDFGSLAAMVEELAGRGVRPTVALCDRAMQEMLESRCYVRTEYLRRVMKSALSAYPTCWQPLNWGVFEETLQLLAKERNPSALNAHSAIIEVSLDCIEAFRRRRVAANASGAAPALPPLFLGAEGDKNGRAVVKRCARWAAITWARRGETALCGDDIQANVCMVMSRAVGESLEAFALAGGERRAAVLEGCQLAAVELESHGEVVGDGGSAEMTARCRAAMLRPLLGRPFFPTLAEVLLHNMPTEELGGVEVDLLRSMLSRHAAGREAGGRANARQTRVGGRKGRANEINGCAILRFDMAT